MRGIVTVALLLALSLAAAADVGVTELFAKLAKQKPSRATFVEKKYLSLLDKPVESHGELSFTPPGRLEHQHAGIGLAGSERDGRDGCIGIETVRHAGPPARGAFGDVRARRSARCSLRASSAGPLRGRVR